LHDWGVLKSAALNVFFFGEFCLQAPVGWALGGMGDDLSGLHREFKLIWHKRAPSLKSGGFGWLIKGLLHFHYLKTPGVFFFDDWKAAATGFDRGHNHFSIVIIICAFSNFKSLISMKFQKNSL
jgi:hypothetical protein